MSAFSREQSLKRSTSPKRPKSPKRSQFQEVQYASTSSGVPEDNLECPVCLYVIEYDNCVMCIHGHRIHETCYINLRTKQCPMCRERQFIYCKTNGRYAYVQRKGGKKRKTKKIHNRKRTSTKKIMD